MKPGFDWQAEDAVYSQEKPRKLNSSARPRLKRWFVAILISDTLVGSGWLIIRQLRQYVAETSYSIEEEINDTLELLIQAQESRDVELMSSFISGRDVEWARNQLLQMESAGLTDRSQFSLIQLPTATQGSTNVTVSANLNEVILERSFVYNLAGGLSEFDTIELTQQFVFRKGSDRWLLSPPDASFWGSEVRKAGRYITAVYPERDKEVSQKLIADLESILVSTCSILFSSCPDHFQVSVRFSSKSGLLYQAAQTPGNLAEGRIIELPTPTILGMPVDDVSYRALYRAYATTVVERLLLSGFDTVCCDKPTFNRALVDEQLHRLGLIDIRPKVDSDIAIDLGYTVGLWTQDADHEPLSESDREAVDIFIHNLVKDLPSHQLNEIRMDLARTQEFWQWLRQVDASQVFSR